MLSHAPGSFTAARVVPESDNAVADIASGRVDAHQTALLEDPPPRWRHHPIPLSIRH